jgi:hypothetical protein
MRAVSQEDLEKFIHLLRTKKSVERFGFFPWFNPVTAWEWN